MTEPAQHDPDDLNPGAHRPILTFVIVTGYVIAALTYTAHIILSADLEMQWQSMHLEDSGFYVSDPSYPDIGSWEHNIRGSGLYAAAYLVFLFCGVSHFALLPKRKLTRRWRIVRLLSIIGLPLAGALATFLLAPPTWTDQALEGLLTERQAFLWLYGGFVVLFVSFLAWEAFRSQNKPENTS
jgi:hypothetical protein